MSNFHCGCGLQEEDCLYPTCVTGKYDKEEMQKQNRSEGLQFTEIVFSVSKSKLVVKVSCL